MKLYNKRYKLTMEIYYRDKSNNAYPYYKYVKIFNKLM